MAYIASTTNTGTAATPSTAVPAGPAANDIVILKVSLDQASVAFTALWPSGFTNLVDQSNTLPDGQSSGVAWKRLTGADAGSYTLSSTGSAAGWTCQASLFRGRDTTNPPTATVATNTASNAGPSLNVSASTITALLGDDLEMISMPDPSNGAGAVSGQAPPASYTERKDDVTGPSPIEFSTQDNVGAGATGTVTAVATLTGGVAGWIAVLVRIPAAAAAATLFAPGHSRPFPFTPGSPNRR